MYYQELSISFPSILEICLTLFEYLNSYNSKSFSITFPYKPIILFILCVASFTPSRPFQSQKLSRLVSLSAYLTFFN